MTGAERVEELRLLAEYKTAWERTDLVARLGFAALSDYRHHDDTMRLPAVILSQLDRFDQARELEEEAHSRWQHAAGAA